VSALLGSPEVPQSRKGYDHAQQARSQYIADIVVGNACASLGSRSFNSSLSVVFGHEMLSPLLTNSFASGEFHKMGALAKTLPSTTTVIVEPRRSRRHHWVHSSLFNQKPTSTAHSPLRRAKSANCSWIRTFCAPLDVRREFPRDAGLSTTTCQQTRRWRLPATKTPFASRDQ
jgi:hypothetical protein